MTPKQIREAMRRGELTMADPKTMRWPPNPPPEWDAYRQDRLRVAVRCALLFLAGKQWKEILSNVGQDKRFDVKKDATRQRISQLVAKGMAFLEQRGCFQAVGGEQ